MGAINATPNAGRLTIVLKDRDAGRPGVNAIIDRLRKALADEPRMSVSFQSAQDIQITTQASRAQYQYTLTGTDTAEVTNWTNKLVAALQNVKVLRDVASEAEDGGLRLFVKIDRERAGRLGVSVQNVNDTLYDAFGQRQVSIIYGQANQYRVILEAQPRYLEDSTALNNLYVTSNLSSPLGGTLMAGGTTTTTSLGSTSGSAQVPLSTFAQLQHTTAPARGRPPRTASRRSP